LLTLVLALAWLAASASWPWWATASADGAALPPASSSPPVTLQGQWSTQPSGVWQTLRGVHFVDERHGWVVGGEDAATAVILSTKDGGRTWQRQASPVGRRLFAVAFWDTQRGWASGEMGTILRTVDGGATWSAQASGTASNIVSLAAVGPDAAWAAVRTGNLRRTTDGGRNWVRALGTNDVGLFGLSFPDPQNGWLAGSEGLIMRTADGGASWAVQGTGSTGRLVAVSLADAAHGWAVGNIILHTADGGTWRRQQRPDPDQKSLNAVTAVDAHTAFAVGDEGRAFSTRDGGVTWSAERLPRNVSLNAVHFPSSCRGWAVGWGGAILHYQSPCAVPPTAVPPTATSTPVPPTPTRTATPTPTLTPTPGVPWAQWEDARPLLLGRGGSRAVRAVYGSVPLPVVISATVSGPITFAGGGKTASSELFTSAGAFVVVLVPEPDAALGSPFELRMTIHDRQLARPGVIAWSAHMPLLGR